MRLQSSANPLAKGTALCGLMLCLLAALLAPSPALARNAYVANNGSGNVSVIDTQTNTVVGSPIALGNAPVGTAITPDGRRAYVATPFSSSVSVIDTQTNALVGSPITTHNGASWVAITPDGTRAYVVNSDNNSVSVIDTQTNAVIVSAIPVVDLPRQIAITPDGTRAYVPARSPDSVHVISTQTNTVIGSIALGAGTNAWGIAITPDGSRAYVANNGSTTVSVIDTQTNAVVGSPITVGTNPRGIAITPDGTRAYVANFGSGNVSVINTQTNALVGGPITVGANPSSVAISPDGRHVYVSNSGSGGVSVIDTQTNTVVGSIPVGSGPDGIAIVPDQPPKASLKTLGKGLSATLNGGASNDPLGRIATYSWNFGDGKSAQTSTPIVKHTYKKVGEFTARLTVSDGSGCPGFTFTGQTAYCTGPGTASVPRTVATDKLGKLTRNERNGTARLAVKVPGKGTLSLSGKRVVKQRPAARISSLARIVRHKGTVKLLIKAKGKAKRKLRRTGKAKVKVTITFTPTGGDPNIQAKRVKLLKR
jgi:YVTN family beta-propeller protein